MNDEDDPIRDKPEPRPLYACHRQEARHDHDPILTRVFIMTSSLTRNYI